MCVSRDGYSPPTRWSFFLREVADGRWFWGSQYPDPVASDHEWHDNENIGSSEVEKKTFRNSQFSRPLFVTHCAYLNPDAALRQPSLDLGSLRKRLRKPTGSLSAGNCCGGLQRAVLSQTLVHGHQWVALLTTFALGNGVGDPCVVLPQILR